MTGKWIGAFVAAVTASPALALAQPAPPPTPPAGNIEERSRQQIRILDARDREDALMTGDTDIILLRKTRLFNLHGSVEATATDNAYLSPTSRTGDGFMQAQAGLGFATRIAGRIDVFADASVVAVRYFDEKTLGYSAFTGMIGLGARLGPIRLAGTYQPSVVLSRDFRRRQVTTHRFRLSASTAFAIGKVTVQPEVHGERAETHPIAYSAWSGGGALTLSAPLPIKAPILAFAQAGYDRRSFDDYFEAFVGTKRKDDNLSAGAGIVWRPTAWGDVRASYSFGRNWSTSDVNRYRVHSGTFGLSASLRF